MSLLAAQPLHAENAVEHLRLDPTVVTATRLPQRLETLPAALTRVGDDALHGGRADIGVEEAVARVPGLFAQSSGNLAQDTRLQIRGFGARSGFGVREVKLLLDGLPLTFADGQSELDEIDVSAIDRIEVLRGAAAALYGNASGGVVQFFTPPSTPAGGYTRGLGGSYGLAKAHAAAHARRGLVDGFLAASFLRLDGYRDHSAARRFTLLGRAGVDLGPSTTLRVIVTGLDTLDAQDPGGLTAEEVEADRRQARPGAIRFDAGEDVLQGRLGTILEHDTALGQMSGYGFVAYRDVASLLPIDPMLTTPAQGGAISLHRLAAGGGVAASAAGRWLIPEHRLSGGIDVQYQRDERRRFANEEGMRGALGLDQREEVVSAGPYLRYAARVVDALELSAGLRYDHFRFSVDDHVGADTDARTLSAWSPGGGVRYSPLAWLTAFGDVGTAFQVPTTTELANPAGAGFNTDVDPQTATSTEIGLRLLHAAADASVTGFVIDVRDVLVPYEIATQPGRTFYRNASRARRAGVELEARTVLRPQLFLATAFTFIDARFVGPADDSGCCVDFHEPGIPPARFFGELAYRPPRGLGGALEIQWTDDFYVDDANTAKSPQAAVGNVRLTYRRTWRAWTMLAALGLNNVFADRYDGRVRINAQGGRFFEPAARFNAYGSIELAWNDVAL